MKHAKKAGLRLTFQTVGFRVPGMQINPRISIGVIAPSVVTVHQDEILGDILPLFEEYSSIPVIDKSKQIVGVISIKSVFGKSERSLVQAVMSPLVAVAWANQDAAEAAGLMLKYGLYMIPIVNEANQCTGMITRRDLYAHILSKEEAAAVASEQLTAQVLKNEVRERSNLLLLRHACDTKMS